MLQNDRADGVLRCAALYDVGAGGGDDRLLERLSPDQGTVDRGVTVLWIFAKNAEIRVGLYMLLSV